MSLVLLTSAVLVVPSAAGPDKIQYPANWKDHVLYTTVDRYDNKQYREHQITITSTKERSPILTKGQSHAQAFKAAGTYDYICGLDPNMKGTIEVK